MNVSYPEAKKILNYTQSTQPTGVSYAKAVVSVKTYIIETQTAFTWLELKNLKNIEQQSGTKKDKTVTTNTIKQEIDQIKKKVQQLKLVILGWL